MRRQNAFLEGALERRAQLGIEGYCNMRSEGERGKGSSVRTSKALLVRYTPCLMSSMYRMENEGKVLLGQW